MNFQFNFFGSNDDQSDINGHGTDQKAESAVPARILPLNLEEEPRIVIMDPVEITAGDRSITMWKRNVSDVMFEMAQQDDLSAKDERKENLIDIVHSNSDLVPSVYEGGFKTWECTYDLICYLDHFIPTNDQLQGQRVLEMGCGSALPGVFCMKNSKAESVDFQDYNREVLDTITLPNIYANHFIDPNEQELELDSKRFSELGNMGNLIYGDWASFPAAQSEYQYDLILTSETIYSDTSYSKIVKLFRDKLKVETGKVLVACKSIYFGCGGDSLSFARYVQQHCRSSCGRYQLLGEKVAEFGNKDTLNREIWLYQWA